MGRLAHTCCQDGSNSRRVKILLTGGLQNHTRRLIYACSHDRVLKRAVRGETTTGGVNGAVRLMLTAIEVGLASAKCLELWLRVFDTLAWLGGVKFSGTNVSTIAIGCNGHQAT